MKNSTSYKITELNMQNTNPVSSENTTENKSIDKIILNEDVINLQACLQDIIDNHIKGIAEIMAVAKNHKVDLGYASIMNKLKIFKKSGPASLIRKVKKDKGEVKSFSNEALKKMEGIYTGKYGGCALEAYNQTHDWLRSISREFVSTKTGECFHIANNCLYDIQNEKIISAQSARYEPGVYLIDVEHLKEFSSEYEIQIGSASSATRYLRGVKFDNSEAMFFNKFGLADFRNKIQHPMMNDYSHLRPNDLWCGDGKLADMLVISWDWKRVYRPWLMDWEDMATRRYCYEVDESENSESVSNSLAKAIELWGMPKSVKHDNGTAYFSGRFDYMKKGLGIKTCHKKVKLARGNPVESLHAIVDNMLKSHKGYTGKKYQEFPEATRELLKFTLGTQRDLIKVEEQFKKQRNHETYYENISNSEARIKSSKKRLLHISEFIQLLDEKVQQYHERVQGGLKIDKLGKKVYSQICTDELINEMGENMNTPKGRYDYKVKLGFNANFAEPSAIAIYAMNFQLRSVQFKTGISFNNNEFWHTALGKYAGQKVLIRYTNPASEIIYVFHSNELQKIADKKYLTTELFKDLKFVCVAEKSPIISWGDEEGFTEQLIIQKNQERYLKNAFSTNKKKESNIHTLTGIENQLPEILQAEENYALNKLNKTNPIKKLKFKGPFDE